MQNLFKLRRYIILPVLQLTTIFLAIGALFDARYEQSRPRYVFFRHSSITTPQTYLKDVKRLELDVSAFIFKQVHHQLQVISTTDVTCHRREVVSI